MAYLDISPMMVALRTMPEEFEMRDDWLWHTPSRHSFKFDSKGRLQVRAECNCSILAVKAEQEQALWGCIQEWRDNYWRAVQINREFASHFRPRSAVRRVLIDLTTRFLRRLLRQTHSAYPGHHGVVLPAE
jgi:hypothetical protein